MKKTKRFMAVFLLSLVWLVAGCSNSSGSNDSSPNTDNKTNPGETTEEGSPDDTPNTPAQLPSLREEVTGKIGKYGKPYQVGDIIFKDGSAEEYSSTLVLSDVQKKAAIALIFYKGKSLNSDDSNTNRTLGVGLVHSGKDEDGLEWCTQFGDKADAHDLEITTIVCEASKSSIGFSYTGDKNGSDNLEQIEAFDGVNDTSDASKYPAFYFAKNYKDKKLANETESRVAGTAFEDGWYLPSLAELCEICWCMEKNIFDIDAASALCGGDKFGSDSFWSSSQRKGKSEFAYGVNFSTESVIGDPKENDGKLACAIREFN